MSRHAKAKPVLAWGGYLDGKLDWWTIPLHSGKQMDLPAAFRTRTAARQRYSDVRRVTITEVTK